MALLSFLAGKGTFPCLDTLAADEAASSAG